MISYTWFRKAYNDPDENESKSYKGIENENTSSSVKKILLMRGELLLSLKLLLSLIIKNNKIRFYIRVFDKIGWFLNTRFCIVQDVIVIKQWRILGKSRHLVTGLFQLGNCI